MKYSPVKTAVLCLIALLPYSIAAASPHMLFSVDLNAILPPFLVLFFFLYRRTVELDLSCALAIYVGVCAIETFPAQFGYFFDAALHPSSGAAALSPEAALFQLVLSTLLFAAFAYPATQHFTWAVDRLNFPKIWYSTVALSSIFLLFNILAVPQSYSTLYAGRMLWLFPTFEATMFAVLVAIYLLFYRARPSYWNTQGCATTSAIPSACLPPLRKKATLKTSVHTLPHMRPVLRKTRRPITVQTPP